MEKGIDLISRLLDKIDKLEVAITHRDAYINLIEDECNKEKSLGGSRKKENIRLNQELIKMQEKLMEAKSNE